jgi:hypothetical protein
MYVQFEQKQQKRRNNMARYDYSSSWRAGSTISCKPTVATRTHKPMRYRKGSRGGATGSVIKVAPSEPPWKRIPMPMSEALAIVSALGVGLLHKQHQKGAVDPVVLRALQVIGAIK